MINMHSTQAYTHTHTHTAHVHTHFATKAKRQYARFKSLAALSNVSTRSLASPVSVLAGRPGGSDVGLYVDEVDADAGLYEADADAGL
jgi:hypothetical protein